VGFNTVFDQKPCFFSKEKKKKKRAQPGSITSLSLSLNSEVRTSFFETEVRTEGGI
jgi:hypothetical protein